MYHCCWQQCACPCSSCVCRFVPLNGPTVNQWWVFRGCLVRSDLQDSLKKTHCLGSKHQGMQCLPQVMIFLTWCNRKILMWEHVLYPVEYNLAVGPNIKGFMMVHSKTTRCNDGCDLCSQNGLQDSWNPSSGSGGKTQSLEAMQGKLTMWRDANVSWWDLFRFHL